MKTLCKATMLLAASMLAISSITEVRAQSSGPFCYELTKPGRFNKDPLGGGGSVYWNEFNATPSDPSMPPLDTSGINFEVDYSGTAPTQVLTFDGSLCLTFDPSVTQLSIPGITGAPGYIEVDGEKVPLCHVCWDFNIDTSKYEGGTVTVYDGNKQTVEPSKPNGELGGGYYNDITGWTAISAQGGKGTITVCFSDLQVCYCPEPSSALFSMLGLTGLLVRRRR